MSGSERRGGVAAYEREVSAYLDYCRAYWKQSRGWLSPEYYPTADGAVKLIWHNGDPREAAKIREAFRALTDASRIGQDKQRRGDDR